MEPNVGRPKGLGNISDIRCRICRHWFIIAREGPLSVFSVRVHLSNVWPLLPVVVLGCSWAPPLLGPASFLLIRELRTEPAFSVACCICASPWLQPLLSWSSLGAHPVAGYVWRPPGVGERADGLMDGKGEGVGCFVRVDQFRNSSQACSRTYVYICIYIDIQTDVYIYMYTDI